MVHDLATAAQRLGETSLATRLIGLLAGQVRENDPGFASTRELLEARTTNS